jgi:hypothetical protein
MDHFLCWGSGNSDLSYWSIHVDYRSPHIASAASVYEGNDPLEGGVRGAVGSCLLPRSGPKGQRNQRRKPELAFEINVHNIGAGVASHLLLSRTSRRTSSSWLQCSDFVKNLSSQLCGVRQFFSQM